LSLKEKFGGDIEMGELAIEESPTNKISGSNGGNEPQASQARLLPCGIFARWASVEP
jgi:hypothetical protein